MSKYASSLIPLQKMRGALSALIVGLLLAACGLSDTPASKLSSVADSTVWEYKLAQGGRILNFGRWYNYIQTDALCATGIGFALGPLSPPSCWNYLSAESGPNVDDWVVSKGPWWIDPNHQQILDGNGFGFINVIAFMQLPSAIESAADLTKATVSFDTVTYPGFSTVSAPSKLGTQKSHVWLWFQTAHRQQPDCTPDPQIGENCTRQSNYILTGDLGKAYQIDGVPDGAAASRRFVIDPAKHDDWTCLGAGLNVKYDCMPFNQAIKQVSHIGFIAGPVLPCPQLEHSSPLVCDMAIIRSDVARYFNVGQIAFRNFNIKQGYTRQTALYDVDWEPEPDDAMSTREGWSAIHYGKSITFKPGNGLRLQPGTGHTSFGLSRVNNTQDYSVVGPNVYLLVNEQPVQGLGGGQIRVVSADEGGRYKIDRFVSTYNVGDAVELLVTTDALAVLKNGEVVHRFPVSCSTQCNFYPYTAQLKSDPGKLPLRF